jgi:hypothetical protein
MMQLNFWNKGVARNVIRSSIVDIFILMEISLTHTARRVIGPALTSNSILRYRIIVQPLVDCCFLG